MQKMNHFRTIFGLLLLSWLVSGCATTANNPDPLEKFNRTIFAFNEGVDSVVVKPVAKTYKKVMPTPVDKGVTNFFSNLGDVAVIANDLLQFKFKQAASDTGRLFLNSTVGLLGFVDVASGFGLPKHQEDFGQTLGYWGINTGPYLVLPILGPSSVRDAFGVGTDSFLDPLFYATGNTSNTFIDPAYLAPYAVKGLDMRADLLGAEKILEVAALDKYTYIRDAYLARRNYLVYDGMVPTEGEDDIFGDDEDFDDEDLFEDDEELFDEEELFEEEDLEGGPTGGVESGSEQITETNTEAEKNGEGTEPVMDNQEREEDLFEEDEDLLEEDLE
jgi:phospholipid-binding lipoprotein MlaA